MFLLPLSQLTDVRRYWPSLWTFKGKPIFE
jgi:hypothetical protein